MSEINFHNATPILRVRDLEAAVRYYSECLGFKVDWRSDGGMASVSRGPACLMLSENDQGGAGSWIWIGVGDVERLFEELAAAKAIIKLSPKNFPWAKEIHVADPDGNIIRFGSEQDESQPFDDWVLWYRSENPE